MNKNFRNPLDYRRRNEQLCMKRITNDDLVCRDCLYRYDDSQILGNTSRCEMYGESKPNEIILGKDCWLYDKEDSL